MKKVSLHKIFLSAAFIGLFVAVFSVSQNTNLISSASSINTMESEEGVSTGNVTVIDDANASAGKYVRLGSVPVLPSPSPTPSGPQLYVSTTGIDSNPGTKTSPFKTITKASTVATAGTTIHVAPGTYNGSFITSKSGTATARVVYLSDTKWGAKIVGGTEEAAWRNNGNYVDINGFDITGRNVLGILQTGSFGRILNNHVYGIANGNCMMTWSSNYALTDVDVIGNVMHGCGGNSLDHGIYVGHTRGTISNNISYGNRGFGIHCWHNCNRLTISNNLVFNNGTGGIVIGQGDDPNNGSVKADNFIVSNNIAISNTGYGIEEEGATGPNNKYLNNNLYANSAGTIFLQTGSQSNSLTTNPDFVNFQLNGSGDYHLKPTSPNINAGTPTGAPTTDIDGAVRPQSGGYDIGVYER